MSDQRPLFQQYLAPTSFSPLMLEIESASGCWLYEASGKKYLDLISGISVNHLGHRHPKVIEAIESQLKKYMHLMVYGEYIQTPQVKYAEKIISLLPDNLNSVYFTNSGTEATEGAMKLVKRVTGRKEFICFEKAYHGSTQGALSMIGREEMKTPFQPLLPGIETIPFNKTEPLNRITNQTAAVFCEPIQGEAGIIIPDILFLKKLRERCDETNTLLVFDECQTAFGKTGKLFAFEHFGVIPDVLLLAKALGGGLPLGAFIASKEMMNSLAANPALGHITTFGGHPVSCAAGLAALQILLAEKLMEEMDGKELLFQQMIQHPIRSKGLLMAIEFPNFDINQQVIQDCLKSGVVTDWFLFASNCLRIAPPLNISKEEIRFACSAINEAIKVVSK